MAPPRRKCVFNLDLQQKYPFIKKRSSDSVVFCDICNKNFSIANAGKSVIEKHLITLKHKKALAARSQSNTVTNYFSSTHDDTISAQEGVWTYHVIKENESFKSSDCASKLFGSCFKMAKFKCARTKCEAIATNVFAPFARNMLKDELERVNFISVSTDASKRGNIKMMPITVRYFDPTKGVRVKLLDFSSQPGDTSEIIADWIIQTAEKHKLKEKVVAYCGDNCRTNFGSRERGGHNNVFYRLAQWAPSLIGVGCAAHIVHNALKYACERMPFDMECIVVKIYSHFYTSTVRIEALKEICEGIDVEFSIILGCVKRRFLALAPALARISKLFDALKLYFLGLVSCPIILKNFFESPTSKLMLLFIKEVANCFNETVLKIESDDISVVDVAYYLKILRRNIMIRKSDAYLDPETEKEKEKLMKSKLYNEKANEKMFDDFYTNANEYLDMWTEQHEEIKCFSWVSLRHMPDWPTIKRSISIISKRSSFGINSNNPEICDQYVSVKAFCTDEKIAGWAKDRVTTESRWVEIFKHFDSQEVSFKEFSCIIEYILCLPGTSAPVERIFFLAKKIWKKECSNLHLSKLHSILVVKYNLDFSCSDFYSFLKTQPKLLKKISEQDLDCEHSAASADDDFEMT